MERAQNHDVNIASLFLFLSGMMLLLGSMWTNKDSSTKNESPPTIIMIVTVLSVVYFLYAVFK